MNQRKGIGATILSSVIYGFTPILARLTYEGGSNSINMVFLRSFLPLPIIAGIMIALHIPFRITRKEGRDLALTGFIGSAATTMLLYTSYNFVSVGMATTLHFAYPLLVTIAGALFFRESLRGKTVVALLLGLAGVVLFGDFSGGSNLPGILLALLSAVTFSFKVVWLARSAVGGMNHWKTVFYLCICDCIFAGGVALFTGQLTFALTPKAWVFTTLVAVSVSVGAVPLLKYGISIVGAPTASILSTLEPITSVIFGIILLSEGMTIQKLVGCLLIIAGVLLISAPEKERSSNNAS